MLLNSSLALHERVVYFLCFTLGAFLVRPQAELQKSKEGSEALRQENLAISRQLVDVQSQVGVTPCSGSAVQCRDASASSSFPVFLICTSPGQRFRMKWGAFSPKGSWTLSGELAQSRSAPVQAASCLVRKRFRSSEQVCPGPGSIVPLLKNKKQDYAGSHTASCFVHQRSRSSQVV